MSIALILILAAILMILAWAIFSNRQETILPAPPVEGKDQPEEPEKILRRRSSDRAIEKEYPEEKLESGAPTESFAEKGDLSGQIKLPFPANDIIPERSRFKLYKRALINSEIYAKRGDIETAISLFKGVKERILDDDIRSKIESNINYLNHFRHRREEDFKKRTEASLSMQQPGELRLKIDGPVPQTINIGVPEKNLINTDEIISRISGQIAKELGSLKSEIDRLKSKPEEKLDLDDFAEFSSLQNELNSLKIRIEELTEERSSTVQELEKLREKYENETAKGSPDNGEILQDIRKEIDNLSQLKHSLDSLHNKVEDISLTKIPESLTRPTIIQAKYDAPIPVHFDPKPVLEILDKLNQYRKDDKDLIEEFEVPAEIKSDDLTLEELDAIKDEVPAETKTPGDEHLFPADELSEPVEQTEEPVTADELTILEAEELLNEGPVIEEEEKPEEETLFTEPETPAEELPEFTVSDQKDADDGALFVEPETIAEEILPSDEVLHELASDLSDDEIEQITTDDITPQAADKPEEISKPDENREEESLTNKTPPVETLPDETPAPETPHIETQPDEKPAVETPPVETPPDDITPDETLRLEKEREIEKLSDAEEDPNDFDLLSDLGKVKDESTLTDDDIFEKILRDDKIKSDDSDFEIIGDIQKDEQEISFNDTILDGKKKAEQDFYRKFIKADRIKKRELPILKVSYDFKKLPDQFSLSREKNILEYSFYKYKPMLSKADEYIKQKRVRDAINYYKVVLDQNIPIEFKAMIKRNIRDLTEYLEKYLSSE